MSDLLKLSDYKNWLIDLKSKIKQSQIKASISVNSELIQLYWDLGRQIVEKQQNTAWGSGFINQLSQDLKAEFPEMSGLSTTNLFAMRKFYLFHNQSITIIPQAGGELSNETFPQVGGIFSTELVQQIDGEIIYPPILELCTKIPWKHNILIIEKIKNKNEVEFYIKETISNNWSRSVLEYQIETNLYNRQGKAITNFKTTLPEIESDLANALLKDPYNFEFLTLSFEVKELELEQKLVQHITQFLLELGKGFAYMGRQFQLIVGGKEFRTDLLFYHTKLKCHVVIELKIKEFEPEFLGKLNFYMTAINSLIKADDDKPTIGILLCKNKNDVIVDFALKDINKPMGVSEFKYKELPAEIKSALPTLEEFTEQLNFEL